MGEVIAFFAGLVTMMIVWFDNDNNPSTSPYKRGYNDGYRQGRQDYEDELKNVSTTMLK